MKFLILVLLSFSSAFALAGFGGNDQGNGGDLVLIDNKYYVLDLAEAGIEKEPFFDTNIIPRQDFKERLEKVLSQEFPISSIARKLSEIYAVDLVMSYTLLKTIEAFQWKIVNSPLIDVPDENTNLYIAPGNLFQLAVRKSSSIMIDRNLWNKIDDANKTALVFHEILYALTPPEDVVKKEDHKPIFYQNSELAREINGYLFSLLPKQGRQGLERFTAFKHILDERPNNFTFAIYEKGSFISKNPYLTLGTSPEFSSKFFESLGYRTAALVGKYFATESKSLLDAACRLVVKEKQKIIIRRSLGSDALNVKLATFQGSAGGRTYMSVVKNDTTIAAVTPFFLFNTVQACTTSLNTLITLEANNLERDTRWQ